MSSRDINQPGKKKGQFKAKKTGPPTSASSSSSELVSRAPCKQNSTELTTGNEQYSKDIFINIEPPAQTQLLVKDQAKQTSQLPETSRPAQTDDDKQVETRIELNPNSQEGASESSSVETDDQSSLPQTTTKLTTPNGAEVFLIGTAHFSLKSVQDVQKVMKIVKPSAVVLELCKERAFMLSLDEESLIERNKSLSFEKIREIFAAKGFAQGLIYITFIKMSAKLTEKLGLAPGVEFRAASTEAQKTPGCTVVLGDRSVKVTVARAVASVSTWQKIKIIWQVLANDVAVTQEEIEKFKEKDILEQLLEQLGGEFPGFKRTILDERNVYLAHSIYHWAQNSETSNGPPKIVAVVGIGHVGGIVENWGKTTEDEVKLLSLMPEVSKPSRTRRIVSKTIKYCSIALLFYVGYRAIIPSSIQSAIQEKLAISR